MIPEGALQVARAAAVLQLSEHCERVNKIGNRAGNDGSTPLPWINSPTRAKLAPARGQYARGAVVANFGVTVACCLIALAIAYPLGRRFHEPTRLQRKVGRPLPSVMWIGLSEIACPGVLLLVAAVLLNGSISSGMMIAVHGPAETRGLDIFLATAVMVFYVAICVAIFAFAIKSPSFDPSKGLMYAPWPQLTAAREAWDDLESYGTRPRPSVTRNVIERFVEPAAEWRCETTADFVDRSAIGVAFLRFKHPLRWWLAVDMVITLLVVMVRGVSPETRTTCERALYLVVGLNGLAFLLSLLRPFLHPFKNMFLILVTGLNFTASLLAAASQTAAVGGVITALNIVLGLWLLAAVLSRVRKMRKSWLDRQDKERVRKRDETNFVEASSSSNGGAPADIILSPTGRPRARSAFGINASIVESAADDGAAGLGNPLLSGSSGGDRARPSATSGFLDFDEDEEELALLGPSPHASRKWSALTGPEAAPVAAAAAVSDDFADSEDDETALL